MAKAQLDETTYLKQVRDQYENLPYPPRDPAHELKIFHYVHGSSLDRLNYYHFGGMRDFNQPFEVLVAGCGTGDAVVTLAAQLYGTPARITALDMSSASLGVVKARLEKRGLDNVQLVHDSLLNVQAHMQQPYDYINCSGVLHHLEVPEAGLAALERVLAPEGVMHLMLYALYGREGVYQVQRLMRLINGDEPDMQNKVDACRKVLADLSPQHALHQYLGKTVDVSLYGDAGLYDLLLHSHDVAYTVPQVYDFLATAKLLPTHWFFGHHVKGNDLYRPEGYIRDADILAKVKALPLREQQAVAELMDGTIARHEFYAARRLPEKPMANDLDVVPHFSVMQGPSVYEKLAQALESYPLGQYIRLELDNVQLELRNSMHAKLLLRFMDGNRPLRVVFDKLCDAMAPHEQKPDNAQLLREFAEMFETFNRHDLMFLKHGSASPYRDMAAAGSLRGRGAKKY
ncbi:MAG: class I SAM-dependent methyltransferase [Proteobacteria bacterium]|nr:class I SAM-dependent methyltransferase [Pseudomonadota bacterium]